MTFSSAHLVLSSCHLRMTGKAKRNHQLGIIVAQITMVHGNRPLTAFQRRAVGAKRTDRNRGTGPLRGGHQSRLMITGGSGWSFIRNRKRSVHSPLPFFVPIPGTTKLHRLEEIWEPRISSSLRMTFATSIPRFPRSKSRERGCRKRSLRCRNANAGRFVR